MIACRHHACDVVNIKLMKCGGIYPSLKIADIANSFGMNCIIGCMSESKLSIAAGAAVAAKDNIKDTDLDSFLSFSENCGAQGGFTVDRDMIALLDRPGLGVDEFEF